MPLPSSISPRWPVLLARVVRTLAACCLTSVPFAGARGKTWREYRAPQFTLLSAADATTTSRWATEVTLFFTALAGQVKPDPLRPPLTILLFANDAELAPFNMPNRPSSGDDHPAYFGNTKTAAYFLLTPKSDLVSTRLAAYHRAFHWWTGADARTDMPAWYTEGAAQVFSTFALKGSQIQIGADVSGFKQLLFASSLLPVRELFRVSREEAAAGESARDNDFFAESWLLMHYTLIDQRSLTLAPARYLALLHQKMAPTDAFQPAFGMSMAEMEKRLGELCQQRVTNVLRATVDVAAAARAIKAVPFAPADLELATGQAYLGLGHQSEAEIHLKRALAARPNDRATLLSLAELATLRNDVGATRNWCDQVLASDPNNAAAYSLRGRVVISANTTAWGGLQVSPAEARTAADDLMHAAALAPEWSDVVPMAAGALPLAQPRRAEDYVFLQKAAAGWPPSPVALAVLAALDEQAGKTAKAREEYEQVLRADPPPPDNVRTFVSVQLNGLKQRSRDPDVRAELAALLEHKEYAKLISRLDELGASATPAEKIYYDMYRRDATAGQTLDQAQAAMDAGDSNTAGKMLHDLLDVPRLDMASKIRANEMLTSLRLQSKLPLSRRPADAATGNASNPIGSSAPPDVPIGK